MPETATREDELAARAAEIGLTLLPIPSYGKYLVIYGPATNVEICTDLDDAEKDIAALEGD